MDIKDSVVIVTGATEGIGRAISLTLAGAGAKIGACARNRDKLKSLAQEIRDAGGSVFQKPCDVSDESQVSAFHQAVERELGAVDVLVNNAGLGYFAPIDEMQVRDFDETMAVNVRGVFLLTRAVIPAMKERGSGHIVNIASLAGKNGVPGGAAYSASKHALLGFSKSIMLELRNHGIRVTSICPGSVETAFFDKSGAELKNPDKALNASDVAETVLDVLQMQSGALVSDLDIRPAVPPSG